MTISKQMDAQVGNSERALIYFGQVALTSFVGHSFKDPRWLCRNSRARILLPRHLRDSLVGVSCR